jgi:hypothetical protein
MVFLGTGHSSSASPQSTTEVFVSRNDFEWEGTHFAIFCGKNVLSYF